MDDAVICFEDHEDAQRVLEVLAKRFSKYGLGLHPQKTRLVEFGREALTRAEKRGTQPATFEFLGHTHVCARSRRGAFMVKVRTMKKRLKRSLKAVAQWCRIHRHDPVKEQQATLNAKLRGHYQYYGRASNYRGLWQFYWVRRIWHKWLIRRTRGNEADLGEICSHPTAPSPVAIRCITPTLGTGAGESRLRNPLFSWPERFSLA